MTPKPRAASFKNDLAVGSNTGELEDTVYGLSVETGMRFDLSEHFYAEPQAELAYTPVGSDDYALGGATYSVDSVDSFTGRAGFAAGVNIPEDAGGAYLHASVVHEFAGDAEITGGNGATNSYDGDDTWVEYGLGVNFNVSNSACLWADLQRTSGAPLDEDWRASAGVRYAF